MNNNIKYCNDKAPKLFGFRDREEYSRNYASSFPEFQPDGTRTSDIEAKTIQADITQHVKNDAQQMVKRRNIQAGKIQQRSLEL